MKEPSIQIAFSCRKLRPKHAILWVVEAQRAAKPSMAASDLFDRLAFRTIGIVSAPGAETIENGWEFNIHIARRSCKDLQFVPGQGGFQHIEQAFLLADHGLVGIKFALDGQPGTRFGETHQPLTRDQLDEFDVKFAWVNHGIKVQESRLVLAAGLANVRGK